MTRSVPFTLLVLLMWLAPASVAVVATQQRETNREPPAAGREDAQHSGREAFDRVCKFCHGPEGRGDAGPRLVPFSRAYEELLAIVREGSGQMPPISTRELSDEAVAQIEKYLKALTP